jgi:hypothetical protein
MRTFELIACVAICSDGVFGGSTVPLSSIGRQLDRKENALIIHPRTGKWANVSILVVPKQVMEIFAEKPAATITLLRDIVLGARPQDARVAGGYAAALVHSPVAGLALSRSYEDHRFDTTREGASETDREKLLLILDGMIKEVAER